MDKKNVIIILLSVIVGILLTTLIIIAISVKATIDIGKDTIEEQKQAEQWTTITKEGD